jgi:hypothetical protein
MLDHVLFDLISALRQAFEAAMLQRQAVEERLQVDVLLGDVSWETSYSLPGEGSPPRVRADVTVDWPTWSQSAYRSWSIGEPTGDLPEVVLEVALRIQRLARPPDPRQVLACLPEEGPSVGADALEQSGPTLESVYGQDLDRAECAIEVAYEGSLRLDEPVLEEPARLESQAASLGRWVASTLVRLGDLDLEFVPDEELDQG